MNSSSYQPDVVSGDLIPSRRWLRFGVLDMMLVTCVIAAWSPTIIALRETPKLVNEVEQMRALTVQLPILDENRLCIRRLPAIWHNIQSWKYYLPDDAKLELRLATEQINSLGDPADFQSIELPTGTHSIHLKYDSSREQDFITEVFIDDDQAIRKVHPPEWKESGGSGSTGDISSKTQTFSLDEQVILRRMQLHVKHPQKKYTSTFLPDEYDSKGNLLWMVPQGNQPVVSPRFVSPTTQSYRHNRWGHRQGIKITSGLGNELEGTIVVLPDHRLVMAESLRYSWAMNALSVRPVTEENPNGEIPEQTNSPHTPSRKLRYGIRDTIEPFPENREGAPSFDGVRTGGDVSDDERFMRVFVHFERFPSGAQPIVEVIFDADHPRRVGMLPHQAEGSTPIQAIQVVTKLDAQCQFRQLMLLREPGQVEDGATTVASPGKASHGELVPVSSICGEETNEWAMISEDRLPTSTELDIPMRAMQLVSDVENFLELQYPQALKRSWQYDGMPVSQTWYLPASPTVAASATFPTTVEVRAGEEYPGTTSPIPGGPVVCNVRVTIPMPAQDPIWLEIDASPETSVPSETSEED